MQELKIWDKEIPYFDEKINNEANSGINTIRFFSAGKKEKVPTVAIFPGGGYSIRSSDKEGTQVAEMFNKAGYNAAVIEYRVTPYYHPCELLDGQRAIKVLRYNADKLGIDENKILVCGFSAGGNLAGITAVKEDICNIYEDEIDKVSAKVNGAILCYPVVSADESIAHIGSFRNMLGPAIDRKDEFSVEKLINKNSCPFFIWHTAEDDCVPVQNSFRLADALIKNKVPCELHIYPFGYHGLGLGGEISHVKSWAPLAAKWIKDTIE
ncbi:MAG: alpha/beta hydrolase [Clostridiales bacterium]|nr:alpha/beta hydrolase [Candidatus Equinaster intestinalis]